MGRTLQAGLGYMAHLMVFPEEQAEEQLLLCPHDFPPHYSRDYCHPDDYKVATGHVRTLMFNHRHGTYNRLLARLSWQVPSGTLPMTFVLDTGAPKHMYLSQRALSLLEQAGRVTSDPDTDLLYCVIDNRKCPIELTPQSHSPANIVGLRMLTRWGLALNEDAAPFFEIPRAPQVL